MPSCSSSTSRTTTGGHSGTAPRASSRSGTKGRAGRWRGRPGASSRGARSAQARVSRPPCSRSGK
eukprot:13869200-Alexandrium_andersonii.AAC.1